MGKPIRTGDTPVIRIHDAYVEVHGEVVGGVIGPLWSTGGRGKSVEFHPDTVTVSFRRTENGRWLTLPVRLSGRRSPKARKRSDNPQRVEAVFRATDPTLPQCAREFLDQFRPNDQETSR